MFYTNNEINRINTAEALCGDILMIANNVIVPYSNVVIMDNGIDEVFNNNINTYLNFCFLVFKNVDFISFDYDFKDQFYNKQIECYGGTHYINKEYSEFWISYKDCKVILKEDFVFSKIPYPFSIETSEILLLENPAYRDLLKLW